MSHPLTGVEVAGFKQLVASSSSAERQKQKQKHERAGGGKCSPGGTRFVQNVIYGGFYARQKKDIIGSPSDYECRNTALGFGQHQVPTLETVEHIAWNEE